MKRPSAVKIVQHSSEMMSRTTTYLACSLVEVAGIALVLWDGIPLFRHLLHFEVSNNQTDQRIMVVAVVLILSPYWACLRRDPPFDLPRLELVGHIFLLVNRLVFIFASGVFSLVVYRYWDVFNPSLSTTILMMIVLFAVFCFSRHLERIGNLLNRGYRANQRGLNDRRAD